MQRYEGIFSTNELWPDEWAGPWSVTLKWSRMEGRYECVGFAVEEHHSPELDPGRIVTATVVHSIQIGGLIERVRQRTVRDAESIAGAYGSYGEAAAAAAERDLAAGFRTAMGKAGGRPRAWGDDHYRKVAEVYAAGYAGGWPTKYVARYFSTLLGRTISHSTAARWVHECRKPERGFLGPTDERTAGGILPSQTKETP